MGKFFNIFQNNTNTQNNINDKERIKLILQGNINEYTFIVEKYEGKLSSYIKNSFNIKDYNDIEGLLQEVFIKAYENLNSYNNKYEFSTWIYRITRNHVLNSIRKGKNKNKNELTNEEQEITIDSEENNKTHIIDNLKDSSKDLEANIKKKEKRNYIHSVLQELPDNHKEALILKYLENKSYAEISDIMLIPENTVATYISRGKSKCKKILKEKGFDKIGSFNDFF